MIDVQDQQAGPRHQQIALGSETGQFTIKATAVAQARQGIGIGLFPHPGERLGQLLDFATAAGERAVELAQGLRHLAGLGRHRGRFGTHVLDAVAAGKLVAEGRQRVVEIGGVAGRQVDRPLHRGQHVEKTGARPGEGLFGAIDQMALIQHLGARQGQALLIAQRLVDLGTQRAVAPVRVLIPERVADRLETGRVLGHQRKRQTENLRAAFGRVIFDQDSPTDCDARRDDLATGDRAASEQKRKTRSIGRIDRQLGGIRRPGAAARLRPR